MQEVSLSLSLSKRYEQITGVCAVDALARASNTINI
jgi:hypothetical protein